MTSVTVSLLLICLLLGFTSQIHEPWIPGEDGEKLLAEERTEVPMPRGVRDLVTSIENPDAFDTLYPGTNMSCKEVLTIHFHTNIHLGEDRNELIAMDGSTWQVSGDNAVELTMSTVSEIAAMRYGSEENSDFLELID